VLLDTDALAGLPGWPRAVYFPTQVIIAKKSLLNYGNYINYKRNLFPEPMPAHIPKLADPPAEDLDSLDPVIHHASTWRPRRPRHPARKNQRERPSPFSTEGQPSFSPDPKVPGIDAPPASHCDTDSNEPLESRLSQLEEVVRDCAVLLRSSVSGRLDKIEHALVAETARLDDRLHNEARRRCRLLTEVTVKVSAAIDQLRLEAKSASA
jgi:hypothetical protein